MNAIIEAVDVVVLIEVEVKVRTQTKRFWRTARGATIGIRIRLGPLSGADCYSHSRCNAMEINDKKDLMTVDHTTEMLDVVLQQ
jgi:hypothetical protein